MWVFGVFDQLIDRGHKWARVWGDHFVSDQSRSETFLDASAFSIRSPDSDQLSIESIIRFFFDLTDAQDVEQRRGSISPTSLDKVKRLPSRNRTNETCELLEEWSVVVL